MKTKLKNEGITLIALVVTIVVLLILAGITITMVLGENGIISQAKLAAQKTKEAEEQQEKDLQDLAGMINEAVNGKDPENLQEAVSSKKVFSHTTKFDEAGNKIDESSEEEKTTAITIPAGFKITEGDPSKINEGVVISDEAGNEFVWVPCKAEEYKNHDYTELKAEETDAGTKLVDGDDHKGGWNTWHYRAYKDWKDDGTNEESVAKYGGFYIARYEAGIPSTAPFYVDSKSKVKTYAVADQKNTSNYAPVSKKGAQAWNYISQENAKEVARKMYSGSGSVKSQLVDGKAWDRTVDWIATNNAGIEKDSTEHGNYADNSEITVNNTQYAEHVIQFDTTDDGRVDKGWKSIKEYKFETFKSGWKFGWGKIEGEDPNLFNVLKEEGKTYDYNHYLEMATGASEQTKLNNIYDLAGNMYELTTEIGYHDEKIPEGEDKRTKFAVRRGGGFSGPGSGDPVSYRDGNGAVDNTSPSVGFRVALYVK